MAAPDSKHMQALDTNLIKTLRRKLLAWYRKHQRVLPWRAVNGQSPNPYHVLVSEAMLQQTQVATVIDYFHRFIEAFPTVESLAAANEQQVLKLWQGLGYYRRARHLHQAAQVIVNEHGGVLPQSAEQIVSLPGVGRYTAGAIASIAFGESAPILDGNVARVLSRWFAIESSIDETETKKNLWQLAEVLVPQRNPGDFNQAMMELGALVCTPKNPTCLMCPVMDQCRASQQGRASSLPIRNQRREPKAVSHHIVAIENNGRYLFQQRPDKGLWSRLWQLVTLEDRPASVSGKKLHTQLGALTGVELSTPALIEAFDHQTTHRKIRFHLWTCKRRGGRLRNQFGRWLTFQGAQRLPLAKPQHMAVSVLVDRSTKDD